MSSETDSPEKMSPGTRSPSRLLNAIGRSRQDAFLNINEKEVDNISLEFFYKPHSISLLALVIAMFSYTVLTRDDNNRDDNIWAGLKAFSFVFLAISALAFPNGPFFRPHPVIWRLSFGLSVLYLLVLQVILFQNFADIKSFLRWLDPERLNLDHLDEKEYAINCSNVSVARVWSHMDIFAVAHFWGWVMKAMIIRHYALSWYISIGWELTEVAFSHLLPNFQECWWDALFLDILLCNGLGIWFGMFVCKKLEMRTFHWESVKNIPSATGKLKRAVLQFTPASWTKLRWLDPSSTHMRVVAVSIFVIVFQTTELNTFFLKHIFAVETSHPLNLYRIWLIGIISAPSIRQYYTYVTDPNCKRLGTQCWVFVAITMFEAIICIKNGRELFAHTQLLYVWIWVVIMLGGSVACVYICSLLAKSSDVTTKVTINGELKHRYLESSVENLTASPLDSQIRQRKPVNQAGTVGGRKKYESTST